MFDETLRSPREKRLFPIAITISVAGWLVIVLVLNIYLPFVALFIVSAHALFLAHITGHAVKVDERQLPDIHRRVVRASAALGVDPPETYVIQAGGALNAFATKLFSRRYIVLFSDLLDAAHEHPDPSRAADAPDEADFVIAHEIGHLAAGHLKWNMWLAPARVLPYLGMAWSRACEYTADRCGHRGVADLNTSSRAMALLAAGGRLSRQLDLEQFAQQRDETGGFWMSIAEINSTHPFLSKRVAAIREIDAPGSAPSPSRHILAWFVAPFFNVQTVAWVYIAFVVGILAAIAIPNFIMMQLKAKRSEVPTTVDAIRQAELAWFAGNGEYLACGSEDSASTNLGKLPQPLADATAACFRRLGWEPKGDLRGGYWVDVGERDDGTAGFEVWGVSDVDGDGEPAIYMATEADMAEMQSAEDLY